MLFCFLTDFRTLQFKHRSQDTPAKLSSPEAQAVLESLAQTLCTDIAPIEARHASNREMSLLRSRGWSASLQTLTSKFIGSTIGSLYKKMQSRLSRSTQGESNHGADEASVQNKARTSSKRAGGGGAYRAFVSQKSSGKKFDAHTLSALGEEYRNLTPDEKLYWERVGQAGTLAHKHGFKSFPSSSSSTNSRGQDHFSIHASLMDHPSDIPAPGAVTDSGAIIAGDAGLDIQLANTYFGPDAFESQYRQVKEFANQERQDHLRGLEVSKNEENALLQYESSASETPFVEGFQKSNMDETASGFALVGSRLSSLVCFEWTSPIFKMVKAWSRLRMLTWQAKPNVIGIQYT